MLNWRKWLLFVGMSLGIATMITLTWIACSLSQSPFPVTIVFVAFVACCLPMFCFHDVQDSDCGDFGWALTGAFGVGSIGLLGVLWRSSDVPDVPAGLTLGAIGATIGTVLSMGWFFIFRKQNKFNYE